MGQTVVRSVKARISGFGRQPSQTRPEENPPPNPVLRICQGKQRTSFIRESDLDIHSPVFRWPPKRL